MYLGYFYSILQHRVRAYVERATCVHHSTTISVWYDVAISFNGNYLAVGSRGTGDVKVYDYTIGIWRQAGRDMTLIGWHMYDRILVESTTHNTVN